MSYLSEITEPLIKTLRHLAGLPVHQLAGHAANFDFWQAEFAHRIQAIDSYQGRFKRLKKAQTDFAKEYGAGIAREEGLFGDVYEKKIVPAPLRKSTQDLELKNVKKNLEEAFEAFAARLRKEELLKDEQNR
jgi:hypothetical protein